ncbi:MAG TPA: DNA gyrase inhibitor YacG [Burkholderiaceae bacterium]|jgi:uncharacterized protein|nr:DNA gyrase inhibitor YacG [Burkholderiaceae bacterium]
MVTVVDCPTCGRKTEFAASNRWRPFCSERCKLIDLGAWATEQYSIPAQDQEPDDGGDPPPARPPRND